MKQPIAILLLISMLLSGCGNTAVPAETISSVTVPTATIESVTEPATDPTFSPEEMFIQSLPEKLRQAYELGIADLELLEDLQRECTIAEAAAILQKVYNLRFYEDSWMLKNTVTEENAASPATRGWFMTMMYAADAESLAGIDESISYTENLKKLTWSQKPYGQDIADAILGEQTNTGYVLVNKGEHLPSRYISAYGEYAGAAKMVTDLSDFDGDIVVVSYALTRYDRTTGEKLMVWDDNKNLHFSSEMTVQEVVEAALRYFRAVESKKTVPYEEIQSFDESIITPALLARNTTLPEASSCHLPAEWHGISYTHTASLQEIPLECDLQVIKDAGFNFINYSMDFTHLYGFSPEDGRLHQGRLKELDQLLAWCMERDIHLNLSLRWNYDWPYSFDEKTLIRQPQYSESIADIWRVLARRYANIPSQYLSFTLMDYIWGSTDEEHGMFLTPAAEAIQEESPHRCIIVNVGSGNVTGETIAAKGVALASSVVWSSDFFFTNSQLRSHSLTKIITEAQWPYEDNGQLVDGDSCMANAREDAYTEPIPPDETAAIAEQYGVGYMINEWGPRILNGYVITEQERYTDETMRAYLTDMAKTMEDRGYGWCYTDWMGSVGVAFCYPLVEDSTYTQAADYLWIDEEMTALFREINNVQ